MYPVEVIALEIFLQEYIGTKFEVPRDDKGNVVQAEKPPADLFPDDSLDVWVGYLPRKWYVKISLLNIFK